MKIAVDTNVLLRDALHDDPRQSPIASKTLRSAELGCRAHAGTLRIRMGSAAAL